MDLTSETVSPSTATVFDFLCLFSHDLKRKQKRWQDGKVTYHTFNKKVMVYDDRSHFIGETHWTAEADLSDGDELQLERGSAIVQIVECVGSQQQDLTGLLEKRVKEVNQRRTAKSGRNDTIAQRTVPGGGQQLSATYPSHSLRPLASVLNSPANMGRAVISTKSPFETRTSARSPDYMVHSRHNKRKRSPSPPSRLGHARSLFGTQLTLSSIPQTLCEARIEGLSPGNEDSVRSETAKAHSLERTSIVYKGKVSREDTQSRGDATSPVVPITSHEHNTVVRTQPRQVTLLPLPDAFHCHEKQQTQAKPLDHGSCEFRSVGHRSACFEETKRRDPASTQATTCTSAHGDEVKDNDDRRRSPTRLEHTPVARSPRNRDSQKKAQRSALAAVEAPPEVARPRTALRITSRQRKGLILLTESRSSRGLDLELDATKLKKGDGFARKTSPENHELLEGFGMSRRTRDKTPSRLVASKHAERVSGKHDSASSLSHEQDIISSKSRESSSPDATSGAECQPVHSSNQLSTLVSHEPGANSKQSHSGPRIARTLRKSVKSKEILGYLPVTSHLVVATSPDSSKGQETNSTLQMPALSVETYTHGAMNLPVKTTSFAAAHEPGPDRGLLGDAMDATRPSSAIRRDDEAAELLTDCSSRLIRPEALQPYTTSGIHSDALESEKGEVRAQGSGSRNSGLIATCDSLGDQTERVRGRRASSKLSGSGLNTACDQQCAASDGLSETHKLSNRQSLVDGSRLLQANRLALCPGPRRIRQEPETSRSEPCLTLEGDGIIVQCGPSLPAATSAVTGGSTAGNTANGSGKTATRTYTTQRAPLNLIGVKTPRVTSCRSSNRPLSSDSAVDLPISGQVVGGPWSKHALDLLGMTRPSRGRGRGL